MIKISIINRSVAEAFEFSPEVSVISITRIENTPAKIVGTDKVLYLFFDDNNTDFNSNHARQILDFILGARRIVVHCDAGLSRSAGVVAGILAVFFDDFVVTRLDGSKIDNDNWQNLANVHVKTTLVREWLKDMNYD